MKVFFAGLAAATVAITSAQAETLQMASPFNDKDQFTVLAQEWAGKVKAATNGGVTFEVVPNGALIPMPETLDAVSHSVVPSGLVAASFLSGTIPALSYVEMLDGLPVENPSTGEALAAIWPDLDALFNQQDVTALWGAPAFSSGVVCREGFLKTKAEWSGKKIRTAGRWQAQQIAAMGAVPMPLPPSEMYVALQNGVVDCALMTPSITMSSRLYEVAPYYTDTGMAGNITIAIMNIDTWKGLTEEQRGAIKKLSDEMIQTASVVMRDSAAAGLEELAKLGKVYHLSTEERAEVAATTSPVFDKSAAEIKDGPGAAMIEKLASYRK